MSQPFLIIYPKNTIRKLEGIENQVHTSQGILVSFLPSSQSLKFSNIVRKKRKNFFLDKQKNKIGTGFRSRYIQPKKGCLNLYFFIFFFTQYLSMICLYFKKTQTIYGVINSIIAIITEPSPALLNLSNSKS